MSTVNPYFDPTEDADILNDAVTEPEATAKQEFAKVQKVYGPDGNELPDNLQKEINQYLEVGSLDQRSSNTPIQFRAMTSILEFYSSMTTFRYESPLVAALAQVVDEMSDGKVSFLYEKYEAERTLLYTQVISTFANIITRIYEETEGLLDAEELIPYSQSTAEITAFVREQAAQKYRQYCERLGEEPDENLIEHGRYTNVSRIHKVAFGNPPTMQAYTPPIIELLKIETLTDEADS